jgi:hypothetical protein
MKLLLVSMITVLNIGVAFPQQFQKDSTLYIISQWEKGSTMYLSHELKAQIYDDLKSEKALLIKSNYKPRKVDSVAYKMIPIYLDYLAKNSSSKHLYTINHHVAQKFNTKAVISYIVNKYGELTVNTKPVTSEVYLEKEFLGYSDKTFMVQEGKAYITIKSKGYESKDTLLTIEPRKRNVVDWKLRKK